MIFQEVAYIPTTEYRKPRNDIAGAMEEFMKMNIKFAQVTFSVLEFDSCYVAGTVLSRHVKDAELPVKVRVRNGVVYLERTDIIDV